MDQDSKILIVGGGAFGTSTAYHLALRGYRNIRVLDKCPPPSCEAATTDINKVIRSDYNEPLYARLGIEAIEQWSSSELFKDLYHVRGWVLAAKMLSIPFVEGSVETSKKLGIRGIEDLTKEQIRKRFPVVTGDLEGWNMNVWNPTAGWAALGEALHRMAAAFQANGVEYVSGDGGHVKSLVDSEDGTCIGVITADGSRHDADIVVIAAGAWTPSLLDVSDQLTAKGHAVGHIQLTKEETAHYEKMPLFDNLEQGYFFPPTPDGIFKVAHSVFIKNTMRHPETSITTSVPHTFKDHPLDGIPTEIEAAMRHNLRRLFPALADRPFCYERLCWDADTADRHFLITPYPDRPKLYLAAGGSAHAAKFLPIIGRYIADMLESKLEQRIANAWKWRPGQDEGKRLMNLAHMDPTPELKDLTGWQNRNRTINPTD